MPERTVSDLRSDSAVRRQKYNFAAEEMNMVIIKKYECGKCYTHEGFVSFQITCSGIVWFKSLNMYKYNKQ